MHPQVRVLSEDKRPSSEATRDGRGGNPAFGSPGDNGLRKVGQRIHGPNASELQAGLESAVVDADPPALRGRRHEASNGRRGVSVHRGSGDGTWRRCGAERGRSAGFLRTSEGSIVPRKPWNDGGGKGPCFEYALKATEGWKIGVSLPTPEKLGRLQEKFYTKAKNEPDFRFYALYDKVFRWDILSYAWELVRHNGGAPGVDGVGIADVEAEGVEKWLREVQEELRQKTYEPKPVRRVTIPKPDGGERPLGIPTVKDRVVQMAAKLVLEPIFEADFEDCAYGYRPGRSAKQAVNEVHEALCEGYTDVVDADLSSYFDTIPHRELMQCVARRVSDGAMLRLVKMWLKTPIEEEDDDGNRRMGGGTHSTQGTPQGGVISPLLANIYIHRFLKCWAQEHLGTRFKARIVNYADDFVILSRGKANEALKATRWIMEAIGLTLNERKTSLKDAKTEHFDFLGYTFGPEHYRKDGHWYLAAKPSRTAIQKLKEGIRRWLRPGNLLPWGAVVRGLNRKLRGWANYFTEGTRYMAYRAIDNFVYERIVGFVARRCQWPSRSKARLPAKQVFGELGVLRLRRLHLAG